MKTVKKLVITSGVLVFGYTTYKLIKKKREIAKEKAEKERGEEYARQVYDVLEKELQKIHEERGWPEECYVYEFEKKKDK